MAEAGWVGIEEAGDDLTDAEVEALWAALGDELSGLTKAENVNTPAGRFRARHLIRWFERGEGAARIRWGSPGDFMRCVRLAGRHMTPDNAKGWCQLRHKGATGFYAGQGPHAKKSADDLVAVVLPNSEGGFEVAKVACSLEVIDGPGLVIHAEDIEFVIDGDGDIAKTVSFDRHLAWASTKAEAVSPIGPVGESGLTIDPRPLDEGEWAFEIAVDGHSVVWAPAAKSIPEWASDAEVFFCDSADGLIMPTHWPVTPLSADLVGTKLVLRSAPTTVLEPECVDCDDTRVGRIVEAVKTRVAKHGSPGRPSYRALHPRGRSGDVNIVGPGDVVQTHNVDEALKALAEGRKVELRQPRQVSTLLRRLAKMVDDAKAKGKDAPNYDLCNVSVKGTNVFCVESKGIPRIKMPQLKAKPSPGSKADKLEKDKKGEVDLGPEFVKHLRARGVKVDTTTEKASYLRASQNQLNGAKVAGMSRAYDAGTLPRGPIFTSADNYVVDGHHRWAAVVGSDLADNREGDLDMDITRVDMPILEVLDEANRFASEWGIPQAAVKQVTQKALLGWGEEPNLSVMVAFYPDPDLAENLALEGGYDPEDLHLTLAYLGEIAATHDRSRVESAVASFASGALVIHGTVNGLARFSPETPPGRGEDVWPLVALVDAPGLPDFRQRLVATLEASGVGVAKNHGFTPHMTLAMVGPEDEAAARSILGEGIDSMAVGFRHVVLAWGDDRRSFRLGSWEDDEDGPAEKASAAQERAAFEAETERIGQNREKKGARPHKFKAARWTHPNGHPRCIRCGGEEPVGGRCDGYKAQKAEHEPPVVKAVAGEIVEEREEQRYTFAPMYPASPERPRLKDLDAHDEFATAEDLQKAVWGYVRSGNRTLWHQHRPGTAIGEMVEIVSWPYSVTVPLTKADGTVVQKSYEPGTVFMGSVWTKEGWEKVKAGEIAGYSLGGMARRLEVDVDDS